MNISEQEFKHLSEVRVAYCKKKQRNYFESFKLGEKKAVTNIAPDSLSRVDRDRINEIKDSLTYPDESKDEFFA